MRIIAGTHRGRRLHTPPDEKTTRPITDRVKESLFNRLLARGALDGENCVDVFAGTGSLGLEAMSRGMEHCTFVERNRSVGQLIEQNLEMLHYQAGQDAHVLNTDAIAGGWIHLLPRRPVSLAFLDPPYPLVQDEKGLTAVMTLIERLAQAEGVCTEDCVVHLRTPKDIEPPEVDGWDGPESHVYGTQRLNFYFFAEHALLGATL